VGVLLTMTRSAAIGLPIACALCMLGAAVLAPRIRRAALRQTAIILMVLVFIPFLLGSGFAGLQRAGGATGMVILPRIAFVEPTHEILETVDPAFMRWYRKWNAARDKLPELDERTSFEMPIQEHVRYVFAPKMLLKWESPEAYWKDKEGNKRAVEFTLRWLMSNPGGYIRNAAEHFVALITYATLLDNRSRTNVREALESMGSEYYDLVGRNPYPLGSLAHVKPVTELMYRTLRLLAIAGYVLAMISAISATIRLLRGLDVQIWQIVGTAAFVFVTAHSIIVALTVFAEPRYVAMNFLAVIPLLSIVAHGVWDRGIACIRRRRTTC
jgi:hypothetical protein